MGTTEMYVKSDAGEAGGEIWDWVSCEIDEVSYANNEYVFSEAWFAPFLDWGWNQDQR